ncbi:hypothetical protein ACJX0J_034833, partial [Zea mays]
MLICACTKAYLAPVFGMILKVHKILILFGDTASSSKLKQDSGWDASIIARENRNLTEESNLSTKIRKRRRLKSKHKTESLLGIFCRLARQGLMWIYLFILTSIFSIFHELMPLPHISSTRIESKMIKTLLTS